jgi:hypothetical protein
VRNLRNLRNLSASATTGSLLNRLPIFPPRGREPGRKVAQVAQVAHGMEADAAETLDELPCEVARLLLDRALCEAAPDIGNRPLIRAQAPDEGRGFRPRRLRRSRRLDSFRGGISKRPVAGCSFHHSPKSIHPVLLWGAVKLVGSRRPVGKVGETHGVFPGLSIGDRAGAVRWGSAQPTVHKFTAPPRHGVRRPVRATGRSEREIEAGRGIWWLLGWLTVFALK